MTSVSSSSCRRLNFAARLRALALCFLAPLPSLSLDENPDDDEEQTNDMPEEDAAENEDPEQPTQKEEHLNKESGNNDGDSSQEADKKMKSTKKKSTKSKSELNESRAQNQSHAEDEFADLRKTKWGWGNKRSLLYYDAFHVSRWASLYTAAYPDQSFILSALIVSSCH